jgi:hypothetical protein
MCCEKKYHFETGVVNLGLMPLLIVCCYMCCDVESVLLLVCSSLGFIKLSRFRYNSF